MGDATGGAATSSDGGKGAHFDCYIGSLISLTSKSDIRYEGILYTIDAENCTIALQNVRSFGTEGRKKEGPQIPPKDNVYEYIIFRGTDIKDLQVKSSPQAAYVDPAIVAQSQPPQKSQRMTTSPMTAPVGIPQSQPPAGYAHPNHSQVIPHPPLGVPPPRDTPPSHQSLLPPGFLSSSYPPAVGLGGLAQWGPRPPPVGNGPMPMYWPGNYYPPQYVQSQPPVPPPVTEGKPVESTSSIAEVAPPVDKPREVLPPVVPQSREVLSHARDGLPREVLSEVLPREVLPPMTAVLTPIAKRAATQEVSKDVIGHSQTRSVGTMDTESVAQEPSSSQLRPSNEHQVNTRPERHEHPRPDNGRHTWRGNGRRGRGRGHAHRTQNFTEDFDFMAMNEKFNKDEVWGELGKAEPRNGEDEDLNDRSWQSAEDNSLRKPVYVKDDFFDSLSCDSLDREGGHTERPRFSEQRKINTETFGDAFLRRGRGYRGYMGRGGYRRGGRPHQAAAV